MGTSYTSNVRADPDRKVWRDRPSCVVEHFGQDSSFGNEFTKDVVGWVWRKDLNAPTGQLTIHFAGDAILEKVRPNDLFVVQARPGDERPDQIISYVLVDRIALANTIDSAGAEHVQTVVSCSDLGKVFADTSVFLDPGIARIHSELGRMQGLRLFVAIFVLLQRTYNSSAFAPNEVVVQIFNIIAKNLKGQFKTTYEGYDNLLRLISCRQFVQQFMIGTTIIGKKMSVDTNVKLWGLLKQYSNEFMNEMFIDVRDKGDKGKSVEFQSDQAKAFLKDLGDPKPRNAKLPTHDGPVQLIFRQRPYDAESFEKLWTSEVFMSETEHIDLGFSSAETYNAFRVFGHVIGVTLPPEKFLLRINEKSIARHGVKHFEPETIYAFPNISAAADQVKGKGQGSSTQKMLTKYTDIISVWNFANDHLLAGTISMRFRPDIRVGTRLTIRGNNRSIEGYVQAVSHDFKAQGRSTTQVTVVRGHDSRLSGDYISPEFDNLDKMGFTDLNGYKNIGKELKSK